MEQRNLYFGPTEDMSMVQQFRQHFEKDVEKCLKLRNETDPFSVPEITSDYLLSKIAGNTDVPAAHAESDLASVLPQVSPQSLTGCTICRVKYHLTDDVRLLPCFHNFHVACVAPWLRCNFSCPACHLNLYEAQLPQQELAEFGNFYRVAQDLVFPKMPVQHLDEHFSVHNDKQENESPKNHLMEIDFLTRFTDSVVI